MLPWSSRISGLSPRVRGNHILSGSGVVLKRSIPACAGEPSSSHPEVHRPEVYPRVSGGTILANWVSVSAKGLSPRVRGNLQW